MELESDIWKRERERELVVLVMSPKHKPIDEPN